MQIVKNSKIQEIIKCVAPKKIAVAYVGSDWNYFINCEILEEIILSPTIGSNPHAINQISHKIGWENVYFLDNLHAKIYIGKNKTIIGSFNLSRNGMLESGLEEIGITIDNPDLIREVNSEFNRLKKKASAAYPSQATKECRLNQLYKDFNSAVSNKFIKGNMHSPEFSKEMANLDISIIGYQNTLYENNYNKISEVDDALSSDDGFDNFVRNNINIIEEDNIEEHTWILMWEARKDGLPKKYAKQIINMKWMYVHQVVSNGAKIQDHADYKYTKLLIERNDRLIPKPPFNIKSETFRAAFNKLVSTDYFSHFRYHEKEAYWSLNKCKNYNKEFLNAISDEIANTHIESHK